MHGVLSYKLRSFFVYMILYFGNGLSCDIIHVIGELRYSTAIQEHKLFKETFPISLISCAKQCLTRPSTCRSFNYFRSLKLCQLSFSDDLTIVKEDIHSVQSLINGWTKSLVGGCETVTCDEQHFCDETKNFTCQLSECGPIPQYRNMKTNQFDRSIGSGVRYICATKFTASGGDLTSICNDDGTWSKLDGDCIFGFCDDPPTVDNSIVETGSNAVGTTRTYTCKPGYEFIGSATVTCQRDGKWSNSKFTCYERCPISKGFSYIKNIDICYKVHQSERPISNKEAKDVCLQMENSTLLTIKTKDIQDYFSGILKDDKKYFIDGSYDDQSRQWKDKSGNKFTYSNWGVSRSVPGSGCIVLHDKSWINAPCDEELDLMICEYANCPQALSYTYHPELNMCYKIEHRMVNLTEARRICLRNGASLLKIDNPSKQSYVRRIMPGGVDIKTVVSPKQSTSASEFTYSLLSSIGYDVGKATSIKLAVKACSDFHLSLLSTNDASASRMYEIVIGGWGNSKSVIRKYKQGQHVVYHKSSNQLDCNSYRTVRVYWEFGNISIYVGGKYLYGYFDTSPMQVNYIGVSGGIWAHVETRVNIGQRFWIDGKYKNNKWKYDTNEEMTFTDWDKNQPNENNDKDVGVVINKNSWINEAFWWDEHSLNEHFFICEYRQ